MAETRRKFDEDFRQGATEWPEETSDTLASVDRRSEAWQPSEQPMSATTTAFSAQWRDVFMLSETVHGRLLMTRNARLLERQRV